jgi:predicted O-methyltransferase YrrM
MQYVMSQSESPTSEELTWYMNQYTEEDEKLFHSFYDTLPGSTMGSLGPHSVAAIREMCEICSPKVILEIGFNVGYSSSMWLNFSDATVYSVDNSVREHTLEAFKMIKEKFGDRFYFLNVDSADAFPLLQGKNFDLAFVDGDHSVAGVARDLDMVRSLSIARIAMDDYWPIFSAMQEVLPDSGYEIEKQWGNIVLCKLSDNKL